jgi:hypothetical protein
LRCVGQLLLANHKLDLSDRKTKRFFKQKERMELVPDCAEAIGKVPSELSLRRFRQSGSQSPPPPARLYSVDGSRESVLRLRSQRRLTADL